MWRAAEIAVYANALFFALWTDELLGRATLLEEQRARETVQVIIKLGPTFVKIGQSLSVRGDLLPAAYIKELTTLQDRVPFFDDEQARDIIKEQLGLSSISQLFSAFSAKPVAAASLGQVYRATLRESGREVLQICLHPWMCESVRAFV
jgi:predicted unusual protein kinase regulating ubiquinone biosynthesis (AarF/ABC1/UbiB family)